MRFEDPPSDEMPDVIKNNSHGDASSSAADDMPVYSTVNKQRRTLPSSQPQQQQQHQQPHHMLRPGYSGQPPQSRDPRHMAAMRPLPPRNYSGATYDRTDELQRIYDQRSPPGGYNMEQVSFTSLYPCKRRKQFWTSRSVRLS